MATIRLRHSHHVAIMEHLFTTPGEHFAFILADWTFSMGEPVFLVRDVLLIPDDHAVCGRSGWELDPAIVIDAINSAARGKYALIEAHNHAVGPPRFSSIDRAGLREFAPYVLDSLPGRPYAATVWAGSSIHGEWFLPDGRAGVVSSVTVVGSNLRQVVSRDDDHAVVTERFDRQLPWFTDDGQRTLGRIRLGLIGAGGTGSVMTQSLAYLGFKDYVIVDDDSATLTNLNRLVTATLTDIGTSKVILARRLVRSLHHDARVVTIERDVRSKEALDALKGVDLLVGCVDNDGARLILNELALAYDIPYIDLAVGIDARDGVLSDAGGRVVFVLPGGPCLHCMGEIDQREAYFFLATDEDRRIQIERGYVEGMDVKAPAVVSLNSALASIACNEIAMYVTNGRVVNLYTELDLLGRGRSMKGQWVTPRYVQKFDGCVQGSTAGLADKTNIERYAIVRS